MRQFLLAIMLMGAAFAGGAVVNGPGLHWLRQQVLSKLADDGEAAVPEGSDAGIPAAPVPSLVTEVPADKAESNAPAKNDAPAGQDPKPAPGAVAQEAPKPADPAVAPAPPRETAEAPSPAPALKPAPALAPVPAAAEPPAPVAALPPLEAPVDTELQRPMGNVPAPAEEPAAPKAQPVADVSKPGGSPAAGGPWADAPDSGPAAAVLPKDYQKPDAAVAPAAASSGDWTALRRRMQSLGVSRYGFEGEPNGRVRFHCVIPLAGRRAVGQQFEAEGDDEFQAAQIALRRVALWQATENH